MASGLLRFEKDCKVLVAVRTVVGRKRPPDADEEDEELLGQADMDSILRSRAHFNQIIEQCSSNPEESYSNPDNFMRIPFPFIGTTSVDRFHLSVDGYFDYMGREGFTRVLKEIDHLRYPTGST
ncbi:uncharacterized protein VTP21DRAFT_3216 [Calcarisporiella thermophila]|uniref:uncharacterized protein n=1 Tax=Calcarisporiella thermophila TaxID=911321 RepID=UPI003743671E